jgi:hypothetical protein
MTYMTSQHPKEALLPDYLDLLKFKCAANFASWRRKRERAVAAWNNFLQLIDQVVSPP